MASIPSGRRVVIHIGVETGGVLQTPPFLRELPGGPTVDREE